LLLEGPLKLLPYATKAEFNASGKDDDPLCLPNTRVDVLDRIRKWADGDDGRHLFWLSGWAGTGKSTIARTIAREYCDQGCLGASFFFSRDEEDLRHAGKFVTTIAIQLARLSILRDPIHKAISENDGIVNKTLRDQWEALVLEPLSRLEAGADTSQVVIVIVIDALDECDRENGIQRVLQLLSHTPVTRAVRFRVLVTSRPEIPIRIGFSHVADSEHLDFVLHDISQSVVDLDISLFLEHELGQVRQSRALGLDWPGEQTIHNMVRKSSGLFIWAATACRFIREGGRFAARRLSTILQGDTSTTAPEGQLDQIYLAVLKNSIRPGYTDQEKDEMYRMLRKVLGSIVILSSPLPSKSLAQLLHTPQEDVDQALEDLHAIVDISKHQGCVIRLHHPSFRDFILDKNRCGDAHFWVDEKEAHKTLADHCILLMSNTLKQDICGLQAPGTLAAEVDSSRVEHCIRPEIQYACLYWVQHLQRSGIQLFDDGQIYQFLREHLLHWLEILSLIGRTSEGVLRINSLETYIQVSPALISGLGNSD